MALGNTSPFTKIYLNSSLSKFSVRPPDSNSIFHEPAARNFLDCWITLSGKIISSVTFEWAKANAAQRTGPSDHEGRHWNDTLTVNLYIASPMMAAYSFAKQVLDIPKKEDKIIKDWFKKIVKKNEHLMYNYSNYKSGSGAAGTPKRAHNPALSSAMSQMQL